MHKNFEKGAEESTKQLKNLIGFTTSNRKDVKREIHRCCEFNKALAWSNKHKAKVIFKLSFKICLT